MYGTIAARRDDMRNSAAFPEISEVSGKAVGLHSYTPVARHWNTGGVPLCGNPRQ
jgi:hypothetical protein